MRLFISYGHPQAVICRKICNVLRARGHEVWFDETHIPHGADWRAEIVKGILNSEGVLSMIDRHSVRDPGVCLDEMSIAIGVRGGNIRYVLLENQAVAEPPASMTTRQWLDMSDWREHENDQAWFETKMKALIQMVESRENQEFAGIIEELRKKLPLCHVSTSKQDSLLRQPFIGRDWIKEKIDLWLDDPDGAKICFVYGDPGIGKSAFAAHYTHYNGRVAAAFFCEYNNTQFNQPKAVIQTLAFLLACRLPDFRIALTDVLEHTNDLERYNESELFDLLLAQPLSVGTVDGNRETMCILIDGLDESGDRDRNNLTEVLTKYADRLPKWLRILTFSRKVEIVTGFSGGADTIDLTGNREENKADVRAYFEDCLFGRFGGDENYAAMIDSLSENSGGIFLYATLMVNALNNVSTRKKDVGNKEDALPKEKLPIEDMGSVPEGLDSAFYRWFQWFFPDISEYEDDWQMPLACIAASPEPIPEEEIKKVFGWTNTKLNKLKRTLEILLRKDVNDFRKDTLQLNHRYVSEWLFSDAAGRFQVDSEDAFREMGASFLEIFKDDPEQLTAYEAYYLWDYVSASSNIKNKKLLLDGRLYEGVVEFGEFARIWSRYETAMKYFTLSEELALAESVEENGLDKLRRYARSLNSKGQIFECLSQYHEALQLYQRSMELSEKIFMERKSLDDLRELSGSYVSIGGIYEKQSQYEEALNLYSKSLEAFKKIAAEQKTLNAWRDLAVSYEKVAGIQERQGQYNKALSLYLKSRDIYREIAIEREDLDDHRSLAVSYGKIASIYEKQHRYDEALQLSLMNMEQFEKITSKRETLDNQKDLSASYVSVARIYELQHRYDEALPIYWKSLEMSKKIARERRTLDDLGRLSSIYYQVAGIYEKQNKNDEALQLYWKSLELREKTASERRTPVDTRGLFFIYDKIGGIYERQGMCEKAFQLYRKCVEQLEKINRE